MTKFEQVWELIADTERLRAFYQQAGIRPESPAMKNLDYRLNGLYYYIGLVK